MQVAEREWQSRCLRRQTKSARQIVRANEQHSRPNVREGVYLLHLKKSPSSHHANTKKSNARKMANSGKRRVSLKDRTPPLTRLATSSVVCPGTPNATGFMNPISESQGAFAALPDCRVDRCGEWRHCTRDSEEGMCGWTTA